MRNFPRSMVLATLMLLGISEASFAQDWDKGNDAYELGDYATALSEFRPLAEQGHAAAQRSLGYMYGNGKGVAQDYKEALKWYRKSAEQGHAAGQGSLGYIYHKGEGVLKDKVHAYMWFEIAAGNGSEQARTRRDNLMKEMPNSQLEEAHKLARECVRKDYKGC
ncbi:MAG: tetratricopeptide repeat protein [Rhodospirillaceae bacterium]